MKAKIERRFTFVEGHVFKMNVFFESLAKSNKAVHTSGSQYFEFPKQLKSVALRL